MNGNDVDDVADQEGLEPDDVQRPPADDSPAPAPVGPDPGESGSLNTSRLRSTI